MEKLIHTQTKLDKEENLAGRESIAKREPSVWRKKPAEMDWIGITTGQILFIFTQF